ncbi:MAG: sulfite exporter TauE/SafE family protein [Planctomycetota bacterium]|nr:sulfite exporter TauE/SafE family protein [Planctomycetota bacterium]
MDPALFTFVLLLSAAGAGLLGSLTGLGGGVVLVPLLVLVFGVDLKYAVGASLIVVIATSSGAAAAFMREGFTNLRVAMLLQVATVLGAIAGAAIAGVLPRAGVAIIFALVAMYSAWGAIRTPPPPVDLSLPPDPLSRRLGLESTYPGPAGPIAYRACRVPLGFGIMILAGMLSAVVGIGGGVLKVLAMDRAMRLPYKVSTTTSNFMIGVTAAASAGIYFQRGQIEPALCAPVALGALAGALAGARVLPRIHVRTLRFIFAGIVTLAGVEMLRRALTGGFA